MMKRGLSLSTIVLSSLLSLPSMALLNEKHYVSVQAGGVFPAGKFTNETVTAPLPKKKLKNSGVLNIKGGRQVYHNTFVELEGSMTNLKYKNSFVEPFAVPHTDSFRAKIQSISGFANLSYRFTNFSMFVPYLTGGAGVASNRVKGATLDDSPIDVFSAKNRSRLSFAWQIGAGVLVPVYKSVCVDLTYKYRDLGNPRASDIATVSSGATREFNGPVLKGKLRTSNVLLGIMFNF